MKPLKFRHEYKIAMNYSDYYALRPRLKAIMRPDPNVDESGLYEIHNIYFDNYEDKAVKEKMIGISRREKFRIRYYNHDTEHLKLEKKSKIHGLTNKLSASMSKEQCIALLNNDIFWMKFSSEPLFQELYSKMTFQMLRPKTISSYTREPYIFLPGNVRVTIDSNMRTALVSKDFFDPSSPKLRTTDSSMLLLEVKYDEFLPEIIRDLIQLNHENASAFSKYAMSRIYI